MAAFSSSFQLLDSSVFLPNKAFSQFYQHGTLQNLDQSTTISADGISNNEASAFNVATYKNTSMQSSVSIVTDKLSSEKVTQKAIPMDKKRKCNESSFAYCAQSKDMREVKGKRQKEMKDICEENKNSEEEQKEGYVHVRARRGQATDRHSLAERVRRERISERMKILQALVPGCDKVAGKALMLDEIINYVQSLQNQVEFLSMKLASVNPMFHDFGMELESLVRPTQDLSSFQSLMSGMQECSPTTGDTFPLLDNSANCHLLQQAQIPNTFPQGHRQVLWEVDDQRQ